ncbi:hypothetical protein [Streptomyces werraensis]|uniref:hypothetical protein n=1 Tax=Streptomyces werraensis TaxID=68284 RepID=UPI003424514D
MKARNVKALRRQQAQERRRQQWEAARDFTRECGEVMLSLPFDYSCLFTCEEAESVAALFRAFGGDEAQIQELIDAHSVDDEPGEQHHRCTDTCRESCTTQTEEVTPC